MADKQFLDSWIGKTLEIPSTSPPSTWTLEKKLSEKNDQVPADDYHDHPKAGAAYAGFICRNVENPEDVAFVRVFAQIPYGGSEYAIHAERARQASPAQALPFDGRLEVENYQLLRENGCKAAPRVRAHEVTTQDPDSALVPGGFLHYIVSDVAKGVQLNEEVFWAYPREERDAIRDGFREAWTYVYGPHLDVVVAMSNYVFGRECLGAGLDADQDALEHLFWDPQARKV
ncbi:uncharacterized protein DSM5745_10301 [Aspergillus mulundensis]|uniref:Uncharacterized protein n=1 Tax=Aspergillus mulundensis TaxID=1810919 RepID=A0A3D8QNG7_9EURO|nr:hypothetical protein DSM5745_10301 [Aspergillus mulundensis]RDW63190.1 hypothetical protein DSM5745_10301 [Aspergillus mulundensis]